MAQQAGGLAVKALIQSMGGEAWGHSIADLLMKRALPKGMLDIARELDKAYIPTRYPNSHVSGAPFSSILNQRQGG